MKRSQVMAILLAFVLGFSASYTFAGQGNEDETEDVDITITPMTIHLGVDAGDWVTVHTNLPYSTVEAASVELNGIPLVFAKSDSLGYFVAKLNRDDVEATVEPPWAILEFTGWTYDGQEFYATDAIRVRD